MGKGTEMNLQDQQIKLRKFLELSGREDLLEQSTAPGRSKVWAQAPWGSAQINPYLGTVELSFYERRGEMLLGDEAEKDRLQAVAREVGSGHWIQSERNAGVRDLNSDF